MHKPHLGSDTYSPSLFSHRKKLSEVKEKFESAPNVRKHTGVFILNEHDSISVDFYRPTTLAAPYRTIVFMPGTAFIASETAVTYSICTNLAYYANAQVIVINSRLAPEATFPQGLYDALEATRFVLNNHSDRFKIDPTRVILAGYSSGGNFAAQIGLLGDLPICGQILICPVLDLSRSQKKFLDFEQQDHVISEGFVRWFLQQYIPEGVSPKNPLLSPFFQTIPEKSLAPTDIIFGEFDKFRSDAEAFHLNLQKHDQLSMRHMLPRTDHSLLWYQKEAVDLIARIAHSRFSTDLSLNSMVHFLKPAKPDMKNKKDQKNSAIQTARRHLPDMLATSLALTA